jgi:plastocyanin
MKRTVVAFAVSLLVLGFPATSLAREVVKATGDDRWNPDFVHVSRGEKVVWKNPARHDDTHTVTATSNNWSKNVILDPGERTSKRFWKRGTYEFTCRLHGRMDGVVHRAPQ